MQSTRNSLYQNAIAKPLLENKWEFLPFVSFWCSSSRKLNVLQIAKKIKFVTHRDCTTNDLWECDEPCREYKESRKHLTDATEDLDRRRRVPALFIKVSSDRYWFLPQHTLKGMDDVSDGHVLLRSMDGSCQVHSPVMRSWKIISEFILSNSNLQPHYIPNQWNCKKEFLPNTQVNTNKMR